MFDPITIGTAIGTATGALDSFIKLFGGDKGHWEGSLYVPGDLQNRLNKTQTYYLPLYNLSITDVNWREIDQVLKTPGIWQDNIANYLYAVKQTKINNVSSLPDPTVNVSNPKNTPPTLETASLPGTAESSSNNTLLIVGGLALLGIILSNK